VGDADRRAAAAQLLALMAARLEDQPFSQVLQQHLWSQAAAGDATLLLDGRRGHAAAHCCMQAAAADWLRVALQPPADGDEGSIRAITTEGRVLLAGPDAALLWVGEGPPPSGLEMLLALPSVGATSD